MAYDEVSANVSAWGGTVPCVGFGVTDKILSEVHNPLHSAFMSFSPYMLGVCETSYSQAWSFQRAYLGNMAHFEVQSMGWFGL